MPESDSQQSNDPAGRQWSRALKRMQRRWPKIAEAADHPLGELLFEKQQNAKRPWGLVVVAGVIVAAILWICVQYVDLRNLVGYGAV